MTPHATPPTVLWLATPPNGVDASEYKGLDTLRMFNGVGQGEGGAPAPTKHHPLVDAQMFP